MTGPADSLRREPLHHLMWMLNQACQFDCSYCFRAGVDRFRRREHPAVGRYAPEQIAAAFRATGRTWRIHLSGGEPFLYPDFVGLARALSAEHELSINTNLAGPGLDRFLAQVPGERVHRLRASLHLEERLRRFGGCESFVADVLKCQRAGFRIRVEFVAHPASLAQLPPLREQLRKAGVSDFKVKLFRGRFGGKNYPAAYTGKERQVMADAGMTEREQAILRGAGGYWRRLCDSGYRAFRMDVEGNLTRCDSVEKSYGNLLAGTADFETGPTLCPALRCNCPYQGLKFARPESGHLWTTLPQTIRHTGSRLRAALGRHFAQAKDSTP